MTGLALLLASVFAWHPSDVVAEPVTSPDAACSRVTAVITQLRQVPEGVVGYCDHIDGDHVPEGLYVLGLRSTRECAYICSNLMGWFAVQRATGRVYHWDVGESRLGQPIDAEP